MEEDDEWEGDYPPQYEVSDPEEHERHMHIRFKNDPNTQSHGYGWLTAPQNPREGRLMTDRLGRLLDMPHSTVVDAAASYQISQKFIAENTGDILYDKVLLVVSEKHFTRRQIMDKIKEPLSNSRAVMPYSEGSILISGDYKHSPVLIWINFSISGGGRSRRHPMDRNGVHDINVEITGSPDAVEAIKEFILAAFKEEKHAQIKWWTKGQNGPETREFYLPKNETKILGEFYPDLGDPAKYIADYISSNESVLLLAGPPGTGKTTLLRNMITDNKMCAHVIYDEGLMQNDNVFQSFLFDDTSEVMIIEDADTILSAREQDGNRLMSRFLNVSDGLIKLPNKKLVFTTNIGDFGKVDHALLRPGRCFGVMHTRALNLVEAQTAAKAAGLPIPVEKREYTIAELFNQGNKKSQVRTFGFGARH